MQEQVKLGIKRKTWQTSLETALGQLAISSQGFHAKFSTSCSASQEAKPQGQRTRREPVRLKPRVLRKAGKIIRNLFFGQCTSGKLPPYPKPHTSAKLQQCMPAHGRRKWDGCKERHRKVKAWHKLSLHVETHTCISSEDWVQSVMGVCVCVCNFYS